METSEAIKLIQLVERQPILYNKKSGSYKRTDLKNKKWHEIAVIMKYKSGEIAQKKFKYLRDKYVKTKRDEAHYPTGTGAEDVVEWSLAPYLSFLDEFIKPQKHCENINITRQTIPAEEGESLSQEDDSQEGESLTIEFYDDDDDQASGDSEALPEPGPSTSSSSSRASTPGREYKRQQHKSPTGAKSTANQQTDMGLEILQSVGAYFARKAADDSDNAFCHYLESEMCAMQPRQKSRLKSLILNFITTLLPEPEHTPETD